MTNDLISREALVERFRAIARAQANARVFIAADAWEGAACELEKAPTVDAEPVKHGRWLEAKGAIRCSECMNTPLYDYFGKIKLSDVCPHCGAKMEVEHEAD